MSTKLEDLLSVPYKRLLFVGIGNVLKSDDGVGVYISRQINESKIISALTVEVSIENYIGKIQELNPDMLVLIDCVDMNLNAGSYCILPIEHINDITFNTHNISLNRFKDFFCMPITILGIQPEKVDFGENLSYIVLKSATKIIQLINKRR